MSGNFADNNHAFATGTFLGWLLKQPDVHVRPALDGHSDYTPVVVISHESGAHWHVQMLSPQDFEGDEEHLDRQIDDALRDEPQPANREEPFA